MICRHYLHLFSVRHAIIQNFQSTRAAVPLLAGYSLRVTAEAVAMTIILHTERGGKKEKLLSLNNFWEQFAKLWCEFLLCTAEQTTDTLEGGIHSLPYVRRTNTSFFSGAQARVNSRLSSWNDVQTSFQSSWLHITPCKNVKGKKTWTYAEKICQLWKKYFTEV